MWWMSLAMAGPVEPGERLEWAVEWMGATAGTAWSQLKSAGEGYVIDAGCDSAGWVEKIYPVHDLLTSTWHAPGGSRRYVTRFREGGFQQDQEMLLSPETFLVKRSQRLDGAWKSWEDSYKGTSGAEDPVSSFYRIRQGLEGPGQTLRFPLFTGSKTVSLLATVGKKTEMLDGTETLRVEVATEHNGDVKGKMTLHLSNDADRIPLRVTVATKAGPVYAKLQKRTVEGT